MTSKYQVDPQELLSSYPIGVSIDALFCDEAEPVQEQDFYLIPLKTFIEVLKSVNHKEHANLMVLIARKVSYSPVYLASSTYSVPSLGNMKKSVERSFNIQIPTGFSQDIGFTRAENIVPQEEKIDEKTLGVLGMVNDPKVEEARVKYESARQEYENALKAYYQSI